MSAKSAIEKWLATRPQPDAQVKADRALIAKEAAREERDNYRGEIRDELMRPGLTPARHEALHALLRESYRAEGYRDDLIFDCGVLREKREKAK